MEEERRLLFACQVLTWQDFYRRAIRDDSRAFYIDRLWQGL